MSRRLPRFGPWLVAVALSTAAATAQVRLEEVVGTGLGTPVAITHAGDDRLFVTDRAGRILLVRGNQVAPQPFLDIRGRVRAGGEQGLLSVAFHPSYTANGRLFVNYTDIQGRTVIARFDVSGDPDRADVGSERILLRIDQPFDNHNGGQLQFGPDGYLYVGMGDGGSANDPQCLAQRNDSLLGKLLRLDVDQSTSQAPFYGIPPDNPFLASPLPDEVWATGLRNPWRFSFDRETGDLFLADVGQNEIEEIDFVAAGSPGGLNLGWKVMEGTRCFGAGGCPSATPPCNDPSLTLPILEYDHSQGCSVTGGYVYRGSQVTELSGRYVYGDFCSRTIWTARRQAGSWRADELLTAPGPITTFGEDAQGELYLATQRGDLFRFAGTPAVTSTVRWTTAAITVLESDGLAAVRAERIDGTAGEVSVGFETASVTATSPADYLDTQGRLTWADGEAGPKTALIQLVDDAAFEPDELFLVRFTSPAGVTLGTPSTVDVVVQDDDPPNFVCTPGPTELCLNGSRFRVRTFWSTPQGTSGQGQAQPLTGDTGTFWFFESDNVEVVVKVLDACTPFGSFWVFAAGLTDVQVTLEVTDSLTGRSNRYENPQRTAFLPLQDTAAFACIP